jgi:prevent-host-death family protein
MTVSRRRSMPARLGAVNPKSTVSGSASATMADVATIPQKELRNQVGEVLRRAEAGERFTITVSGRPVAELGPVRARQWVPRAQLVELWATPPDPTLDRDLEMLGGRLTDPWADT